MQAPPRATHGTSPWPRGPMTGVEALLRWEHPSRGLVQPDQFIPTA